MHRQQPFEREILLALILVPLAALAEVPKVVVLPFVAGDGATELMAQRFSQTMLEQLKARSDFAVVTAPPSTPGARREAGVKPVKVSPEAASSIEAGKKAFADLKFDEAYDKLKKGIELSLVDPVGADFPKLLEAQLMLAVSAFRNGEEKDASAALLTLARLSPQAEVAGYPPVFLREWDKAKKKVEKLGKQQLTVDGPPGSTAFVDGRDLGMVPVEEQVAPGTHYVRVDGTRGEKWGQTVEVKAATRLKAAFAASPDKPAAVAVEPKMGTVLDGKSAEKLAAWCAATGADFALVGVVWRASDTELSVATAVYWQRKEGFAALQVLTFPEGSWGTQEAVKVLDKFAEKVESFGAPFSLPHALIPKGAARPAADDYSVATVKDRPVVKPAETVKPNLIPKPDDSQVPIDEPPPEVVTTASPVTAVVLIVVGVVVAAGAGVGTYFIVSSATKPVTGTVTASW